VIEWDNTWYTAWHDVLLPKLDLEDMVKVAKVFDVEARYEEWHRTDDEKKGSLLSDIHARIVAMRHAEEYQKKADPALRAIKELMGIWR
jgi:hypothetical protein